MKEILKHNKLIVVVILVMTVFFAIQLPKVEIDNDIEVFLPDDHISKVTTEEIEDIFGENDGIVTAVRFKEGSIFDYHNISRIENITHDLENIKEVDEVTSLTNVDFIEGTAEGMLVENLVTELPRTDREKYQIKENILSWDFYRNNLYSDDFQSTQILITLNEGLSTEEENAAYYKVEEITEEYNARDLESYISGATAINVRMGDSMLEDIKYLIPFIVLVLILTLYIFFRKILPVILIMLNVSISSIWAVGLMAYLGVNLTLVSTVIPVLLIAVGSAYGIHILSHYYDYLAEYDGEIDQEKQEELVLKTVKQLGKPVFLAALTTAVGFGSLASSEIIPIRTFGIFTAIGISTAFIISLFLIPSLLILIFSYQKDTSKLDYQKIDYFESTILKLHKFYSNKRISIIITALIIVIVSIIGLPRIVIDTPLIEMFRENSQIRQADDFINQNFAGTTIMNVMIEGEDTGSLNHPQILKPMADMQNYMSSSFKEVGKMSSIADYIKRMNQVMHYPEEEIVEEETDSQEVDDGASFYNQSEEEDNDTGSFYQENNEADTGSFYEEENSSEADTGSFYEAETEPEEETPAREIIPGPDREQNLSEYEFMMLINRALARADRLDISADEMVRLLNQEMNYQAANYYEIPVDLEKYGAEREENLQNLISQYLLLYSGSLDDMINDDLEPDKAQILVQLNDPSTIVAGEVRETILNYADNNFPDGYETTVSGNAVMAQAANDLIVSSQTRSILISFIVVFLIVSYSFKSLIAGIYGIIPLAFALLINFALMGYTGIKLDVGTAMVASIAIGIGVDYTIHFLHSYHKERLKSDDLFLVTQNTLTSTGKAIIFNAISVAAGFMVLLFSNFYPLVYLGLLITVTMFSSSMAALTILPLMLNIFKPKFIQK
ncbi:efflux RND transporter permease subunit [Halanaerobium hydrogeniformans]|uniref:SSD domain-containing protein n=1 Tax=Halanaerobium hydrogeniformans TaxID=656519 RepID=E4RN57_HALHG|nr:MMPL family transporter [Halanaerobium hydrogeniformans]ADQ14274.1 hypothetical protein Halsa_0827 [Halanaerobium hydrogeniformans]